MMLMMAMVVMILLMRMILGTNWLNGSLISILSVLQLAPRLNPKLVKVVMMRIQTLNNLESMDC